MSIKEIAMPIKIQLPSELENMIPFLEGEAKKHDITFHKAGNNGWGFGHGFEASYTIRPGDILLTIHKKPLLVSKSRIVKEVDDYVQELLKTCGQ